MGYTKHDIISKCTAAFGKISTFYKQNFVNYRGHTRDTNELFTEVIAEFLCDHIDEFKNGIPTITRESTYKTPGHDGVIRNGASSREEELIAMQMYGKKYDFVGNMIDYQTPLKSERSDKAGKIDLLAYDGSVLRILELKKPNSDETTLRCVLEGFTYLRTVSSNPYVLFMCLYLTFCGYYWHLHGSVFSPKSLFLEFGMISCGFNLHKFHLKKVALRSAA